MVEEKVVASDCSRIQLYIEAELFWYDQPWEIVEHNCITDEKRTILTNLTKTSL
jgi:hypothetical protein